jgi:hypothetical protein
MPKRRHRRGSRSYRISQDFRDAPGGTGNFLVPSEVLTEYEPMHPEQIRIFKAMPPSMKLQLAANFQLAARQLKKQSLKMQHPDWTDEQIQHKVRELFLYAAS